MKCLHSECTFNTDSQIPADSEIDLKLKLLDLHEKAEHSIHITALPNQAAPARTEKYARPKLELKDGMVAEEEWEFFLHNWNEFKRLASPGEHSREILGLCLGEVAGRVFNRVGSISYDKLTEQELINEAKSLAVRRRNKLVNRIKLAGMVQGGDETVTSFETRLKPIARTGKFKEKCHNCAEEVDFTEQMVLDHLIRGLADEAIQTKVLAMNEEDISLPKVVKFIESEELAKWSLSDTKAIGPVSGLSSYKKTLKSASNGKLKLCRKCGENAWPHTAQSPCPGIDHTCEYCDNKGHMVKVCKKKKRDKKKKEDDANKKDNDDLDVDKIDNTVAYLSQIKYKAGCQKKVLKPLKYDKVLGKFVNKSGIDMHRARVDIRIDRCNYSVINKTIMDNMFPPENSLSKKMVNTNAVADTGACVCCSGTDLIRELGVDRSALFKTNMELSAANKKMMTVLGCIPVLISAQKIDKNMSEPIHTMLYVVEELKEVFLSREALTELKMIPDTFPLAPAIPSVGPVYAVDEKVADCGCLKRTTAPDPPGLPLAATENNRKALRQYLLDHYASSTFNTCEHQPLPLMHGPPLELHVDPTAKPFAAYTPASVPVHWAEKVRSDLERDVELGVLERVNENIPVTWCHRMVVCRKRNGDPRRTVDLQPLNSVSIRQCHPTAPPLQQAMDIPHGVKKSTLDAWNGYHSVEIRESDRHLTTFITPWGRFRYKTAPQGYLASGDAYTHRYDKITMGFRDIKRVIDDTLLHSKDIESSFHHVAKYLTLVGSNGIILNPDKFNFAEDEVDWAGIRVTKEMCKPLDAHVDAIRNFPLPMNITDMRSFMALVNQVAPYYAVQPHLLPFRELLKKGSIWYWDNNLTNIFEETKAHIADNIVEGITRFDLGRWTAVMTDWSKVGIGYIMSQKYCSCQSISPICCTGGWKVCMVGSSFTSPAESNYAPIEGECLGVANALKKTRYYTQGCEKLIVGVDHKPLLGVLNDKSLESIDNPRLMKLKEKTLGWRFQIVHIPGRKLGAPDAFSRSPAAINSITVEEDDEAPTCREVRQAFFGYIRCHDLDGAPDYNLDVSENVIASMQVGVSSVTWEMVKDVLHYDKEYAELARWIDAGCQDTSNEHLKPYLRVRKNLRTIDGVPMNGDRVIIPECLRDSILEILHSAHQGVLGMGLRANQSVYWPGLWDDLDRVRNSCRTCVKIAPSQANLPPIDPITPEYPFQHICADFFMLDGHVYGVFVDRFTGWPGLFTGSSGDDVTTFLARVSEKYGCPMTCTTDGGSNFVAENVQKFMKAYGIEHRISSVANPHSNCRAELAVKTVKRMLRENVGVSGKLDQAKVSRALMQLRNTPDRDTGLSPAVALMGRQLRDFLPVPKQNLMGEMWTQVLGAREEALAKRALRHNDKWSEHTKPLEPLRVGDHVLIQNQTGNHPKRWDKRGVVASCEGFDQYIVVVDGSRRLTRRNRKFLRRFEPFDPTGRAHRGNVKDTPRDANNSERKLTSDNLDRSKVNGNPSQVTIGSPGVQERNNHSPSSPLVQTEERMEPPQVDRSCQRETIEPEVIEMPATERMENPVLISPRRSNRSNKGQTSRFRDYETKF